MPPPPLTYKVFNQHFSSNVELPTHNCISRKWYRELPFTFCCNLRGEKSKVNMIKLKPTIYTFWKTLMEVMLYNKDVWFYWGRKGKPSDMSDPEWKKMNLKIVFVIRQWLDLSVYLHVEIETDTHKIWNKLKELYERKNVQNKAYLIRKLVNMKYEHGN